MRVEFTTEGGIAYFPGLSRPVVIDTDNLSEPDAAELQRLLDDADFFERPAPSRTIGAVWRKSTTRAPAISAIVDVVRAAMRQESRK